MCQRPPALHAGACESKPVVDQPASLTTSAVGRGGERFPGHGTRACSLSSRLCRSALTARSG